MCVCVVPPTPTPSPCRLSEYDGECGETWPTVERKEKHGGGKEPVSCWILTSCQVASLTSGREKEKRTKKEKEWEFVFNAQSIVMIVSEVCVCGGGGGGGTITTIRLQELCESRGGSPGLPVPNQPTVSVDVKQH